MQIRRSATGIEILAPAKINLFFEVLSRRDDGFHEIETLMVPISLFDTLILEDDPSGQISLTARWVMGYGRTPSVDSNHVTENSDQFGPLPEVEKNHVVRAIRLLGKRAGIDRGVRLTLVKRIPSAAGLGGGSSDAAAALLAANLVWDLHWPTSRLSAIAAELGSDVPFFLTPGPAICRGRGEIVQSVDGLPALHIVVVRPPEGLTTPNVYQACKPGQPPRRVEMTIEALRNGDLAVLGPVAHNRLLNPARELSPWIDRVLDRLAGEDCSVIGMSGSGSACFALFSSAGQAKRAASRLRARQPSVGRVWFVNSV